MEIPGKEGVISLQELKKFMQKANYKISNSSLKEKFNVYDQKKSGEIFFDDFCSLLQGTSCPCFTYSFIVYRIILAMFRMSVGNSYPNPAA
jgi:Ca2+-binding EF-hand superfamily protein